MADEPELGMSLACGHWNRLPDPAFLKMDIAQDIHLCFKGCGLQAILKTDVLRPPKGDPARP